MMNVLMCVLVVLAGLHSPLTMMEPLDVVVQEQRYNGAGECYYAVDYAYQNSLRRVQKRICDGDDDSCVVYDFNADGKLLSYGLLQGDGSVDVMYDAGFDARGNMLECGNHSGNVENYRYTYDENDNLLTIHRYEQGDKPSEVWVYTYDDEGRRASRKNYVDSGVLNVVMKYAYNDALPVREDEYTAEGKLINWRTYTYTADKRLYKTEYGNIYEGLMNWTIYDYDKAGHLLSETQNDRNGVSQSRKLAYDEAGNCLSDYTYYANGSTEWQEMKYDARGNLLEKFMDYGDGSEYRTVYKYRTILFPKNMQLHYDLTDNMSVDFAFAGN